MIVGARQRHRIRVARTIDELAELRPAWASFRFDGVDADPEYFETVLRYRPGAVGPYVLVLERDGEPDAMIVGRVEDMRLRSRIGYANAFHPRVRGLTVVQRGFIGNRSEENAVLLFGELRRALALREADVLRVRLAEVGSPLHRLGRTAPSPLVRERFARSTPRWRLELPSTYDEFVRSRSSRTRANLSRIMRRITAEEGLDARVEVYRRPADLERLFEDTRTVYRKTYQGGLGVGFEDTDLARRLTALSLERGWFRGFLVYIGDAPVAFWHGQAYGGVFTTGPTGYDPAYRDLNLGTYLLANIVETFCDDDGVHSVDWGFGEADYKRRFGSTCWQEEDVLVFASTAKGLYVNSVRTAIGGVNGLAKRVAGGEAVVRLRRAWRRRAAGRG